MKRILVFLLTLSLTLGMAGVFAEERTDIDRTLGTPEREAAEEKTFAMYPIGEDITLTVWVPFNSGAAKYIDSFNENEALLAAQERTGVKLDFIHPAIGQEQEQFNLLTTSGSLPDIMQVNTYYPGGVQAGVADGLFADLTDLIDDYSPTYAMLLDNVDEFWQDATVQDGRVLAYYLYKEADAQDEGDHTRIQARTDWMAEAGFEVLRTLDDYEAFFEYILENKEGVTPYGLTNAGYDSYILTAWGMLNDYYAVDGQIHHPFNEPELEDYLTRMHDWYEKGYISPDFTSAKNDQLFYAGQLGAYVGSTATTGLTLYSVDGIEAGPQPYVRKYEGQQVHSPYKLTPVNSSTTPTQIAASSKYIREAMMFMDYGFTLEGSYNYGYGPYEKAWVYGEDGQPEYTDYVLNNERFSDVNDLNFTIRYHTGLAFMRPLDRDSLPNMTHYPELRQARLRWMDDPNMDTDTVLPAIALSEEATAERAQIMTDVETYAKEMILKFIVGAEPLSNFDAYLQQLSDFGIERALALTQEAYDLYQAKTR